MLQGVREVQNMNLASSQSRCDVQQILEQAFNSLRVRLQVYLLIITPDKKGIVSLPLRDCFKLAMCLLS